MDLRSAIVKHQNAETTLSQLLDDFSYFYVCEWDDEMEDDINLCFLSIYSDYLVRPDVMKHMSFPEWWDEVS